MKQGSLEGKRYKDLNIRIKRQKKGLYQIFDKG